MILLNICAVRAVIVFVTLLVGLSSPPVVFDQADQNISCGFSSDTAFSLSDAAPTVTTHSLTGNSTTLLLQLQPLTDSIFYNAGTLATSTLELDLGLQHGMQSLTHWAEWATSKVNFLAVGLMCVGVIYVSLLCTILYYIWTHTNRNKTLTRNIRIANATLSYMESTRSVWRFENDKLKETGELLEKELREVTTQSDTSQQLVVQAQQKSVSAKEELKKERMNVKADQRQLYSEHLKILSEMNGKLEDNQRQVSQLQKLEAEAVLKSTSLKTLLEKERKEWTNKQLLLSNVVRELQQELQDTKEAQRRYTLLESEGHDELLREGSDDELYWDIDSVQTSHTALASEQSLLSVQLIETKLRLATNEIVKLNSRFSYSVINECSCDEW